jgi:hypothetical protein
LRQDARHLARLAGAGVHQGGVTLAALGFRSMAGIGGAMVVGNEGRSIRAELHQPVPGVGERLAHAGEELVAGGHARRGVALRHGRGLLLQVRVVLGRRLLLCGVMLLHVGHHVGVSRPIGRRHLVGRPIRPGDAIARHQLPTF